MLFKWWMPSRVMPAQPWIHPEAVRVLESILRKDMTVCEFGGGGSTNWLANRVDRVITYEGNSDWFDKINKSRGFNVSLRYSNNWLIGDYCDLLFIDGEPVEKRIQWLNFAPTIASEWIVLDNANRPELELAREALKEYAVLDRRVNGNEEGTLYLVTEFWRVK